MLDGARLNVATFVSTWMEPQAERLMAECFDKNMIDKDECPQVRRGFTHDMAEMLLHDLQRQLPRLHAQPAPQHDAESGAAFAH